MTWAAQRVCLHFATNLSFVQQSRPLGVSKKKNKNTKKADQRKNHQPVDERRVAAYVRLMEAEQIIYDRWETEQGPESNWVGELVGFPADTDPWVMALGEKVAALAGALKYAVPSTPDRKLIGRCIFTSKWAGTE